MNEERMTAEHESPRQEDTAAEAQTPEVTTAQEEAPPVDEVAQLQAQIKEQEERVLRTLAEMENLRRRVAREKEETQRYAVEKFAGDVLSVIDHLELALNHAGDDEAVKPIREGVDLTLQQFLQILGRHGVERIEAAGKPFDPREHQAVGQSHSEEIAQGFVAVQMAPGYRINTRILRPAMVMVSLGPQPAATE
ncbi:MAG: nucleotide exchange factor GrpE [Alphaproteobacteria bacterium CG_4_10_14_0_2_um_filter_63_37]|nr:MAG: nucleotide exchange factor GrpE [Alphaproteobacteria bacterium CG_4_10_14_0_2_um_filter_63_37]